MISIVGMVTSNNVGNFSVVCDGSASLTGQISFLFTLRSDRPPGLFAKLIYLLHNWAKQKFTECL